MNMTNVLHRRSQAHTVEHELPSAPDFVPPSLNPPGGDGGRPSSWPIGAKVLVAILLVAAVLGAVGTAVGFSSGDDGAVERQLQERVATLTQDRDAALDAVDALDAQVLALGGQLEAAQAAGDDLDDRISGLEVQIATLTGQRDAASALADELTATVDEFQAAVDELGATIDEQGASIEVLDAALATAQQRAKQATADRDALAKLFPMKFDASIGSGAAAGVYDVNMSQIYCAGLSSCGKAPALSDLTISKTSAGNLRFSVPGFAEGGLFRADGALHAVVDSKQAIPACDGTARTARVAMTIFPGSYSIANDGVRTVAALTAVITVEAPATGSCPPALAFYSADLT